MFKKFCLFTFLISVIFLTSCGYRLGINPILPAYKVEIPFIEGDREGIFTKALIKQVASFSPFTYVSNNADARLDVRLLEFREENVGFRYDQKKKGKIRNNIIPIETRLVARAEISLLSITDGTILLGPVILEASIDFDHECYPNREASNVFSLGQLTDLDAARDAALYPLSRELASKITTYLNVYEGFPSHSR